MFLTHDNSGKGRSHNRDKDGSEACGVVIARAERAEQSEEAGQREEARQDNEVEL